MFLMCNMATVVHSRINPPFSSRAATGKKALFLFWYNFCTKPENAPLFSFLVSLLCKAPLKNKKNEIGVNVEHCWGYEGPFRVLWKLDASMLELLPFQKTLLVCTGSILSNKDHDLRYLIQMGGARQEYISIQRCNNDHFSTQKRRKETSFFRNKRKAERIWGAKPDKEMFWFVLQGFFLGKGK